MRRMNQLDMEALENMNREISRLTRMVEDLLLMAQAESGRREINLEPVEMDTLLLEVFQQIKVLAGGSKNIQIESIDQVRVLGDADRLKQVILNLISNAIKFSPREGMIWLKLWQDERRSAYRCGIMAGEFILRRSDISLKDLSAERSRSKIIDYDQKGYGLGLSIANVIMLRHQGRIEVESMDGEGATFIMVLPPLVEDNTSWGYT